MINSSILESFVTVLGSKMIDALYNDKFFYSLFQNAQDSFGASDINRQGDLIKLNVKPTFTSADRTENTDVTFQNGTISAINLQLNRYKTIPIQMSQLAQTKSTHNLVEVAEEGAINAMLEQIETDFLKDIALDTGIPAGNKFTVTAMDKSFLVNLEKRFFNAKAGQAEKWLFVDPDDYEIMLSSTAITGDRTGGELSQAFKTGVFTDPRFGINIRRSALLDTNGTTSKKRRIACTSRSLVMASRPLAEIIAPVSKRVDALDRKFSLLFSLDGSVSKGMNYLTCDSLYGVKAYQPNHVFVIER